MNLLPNLSLQRRKNKMVASPLHISKKLLLLISFVISFAGISAQAANCISAEDMTDIASHFSQFSNLSGKEFCHDGSETANLLASLMFMRKNQFAADMKPSTDELFSGKFANSWYKYFTERINEMTIDTGCPKGVAAYVYGFGGNTMYVCSAALNDNFSALDRASIFMHEARHIDGYPHITCSTGPRKGLQGACDSKISDTGSYAVTVETYAQLAKYSSDLHPALKAYARSAAVIYADEAFETPVRVQRETQLLLMTEAKDLLGLKIGSSGPLENLGQTPALGHIIMRAQHMVLLPDDRTLPMKYFFVKNVGEIAQSPGDAFTEYNAQTPAQRSEFVDFQSGTLWNAKVYKSKIVFSCDPRSAAKSEQTFNGSKAVGIMHLTGYDRNARMNFVATEDGSIYEFGCNEQLNSFLRPSTVKVDQHFKRIHKTGDGLVGLASDGRIYQLKDSKSLPLKTAVDGQIHEIAPRQVFNFFDSTN